MLFSDSNVAHAASGVHVGAERGSIPCRFVANGSAAQALRTSCSPPQRIHLVSKRKNSLGPSFPLFVPGGSRHGESTPRLISPENELWRSGSGSLFPRGERRPSSDEAEWVQSGRGRPTVSVSHGVAARWMSEERVAGRRMGRRNASRAS